MEQMTIHIGIEPGSGLVGRFGNTVIVIPRGGQSGAGTDEAVRELLGIVAAVAADSQLSASMVAARLAGWVIGRMPEDAIAFGMVAPVSDGVVMFLRGAVWCSVTEGGSTRQLSGERALTWVDQIVPSTFDQLAVGTSEQPVQPDPVSDLRDGVVPGQGFVLTRLGTAAGSADSASAGVASAGVASADGAQAAARADGAQAAARAEAERAEAAAAEAARAEAARAEAERAEAARAEAERAEAARAEAERAEAARVEAEAERAEAARAEAEAERAEAARAEAARAEAARAEAARAEAARAEAARADAEAAVAAAAGAQAPAAGSGSTQV